MALSNLSGIFYLLFTKGRAFAKTGQTEGRALSKPHGISDFISHA